MGEIMREIASNRQVICITHLPQIAALGQQHFKVRKTETKAANQTTVTPLNPEDRLMEIAQLLSGANVTEAAILNARHLLADNHP
jgi:DNA repair protein RecN (Recombination protein N)